MKSLKWVVLSGSTLPAVPVNARHVPVGLIDFRDSADTAAKRQLASRMMRQAQLA